MKGDFTRDTFDPARHFSRVLMQQGRVQLDADFNEQAAILLRYMRLLAVDLIGPAAGPEGRALGFDIITKASNADLTALEPDATRRGVLQGALNKGDAIIGPGRYYVNGVLVENTRAVLFSEQAGYPFGGDPIETLTKRADAVLMYLDVWERLVTHVDDDRIREAALDGPDTCARAQVVWQVRALPGPKDGSKVDCSAVNGWTATGDGRLRARARRDRPATNLCTISPDARYRGAENQLYRVEVHAGGEVDAAGAGVTPTFKWSRDNGSVIFPVRSVAGTTIAVDHLGRDTRSSLAVDDWVELVDDSVVYREAAGPLARVEAIDREALLVTLSLPQGAPALPSFTEDMAAARHVILRRWDHTGDPAKYDGALAIEESESTSEGLEKGWIDLEDGVQVWFEAGGTYRTGDYWLIPARVATGDVEWPDAVDSTGKPVLDDDGNPIGATAPPNGPVHYYAPLRFMPKLTPGTVDPGTTDCRCKIRRLQCLDYRYAFSRAGIGGNNI